jgi:putative NIF3 family GTP cyclohydrolase 1 type 2
MAGTISVIATDVFVDAAQGAVEGARTARGSRIFVHHPIRDATDDEIRAKADAIIDNVIAALTK